VQHPVTRAIRAAMIEDITGNAETAWVEPLDV